jgi:hypothetical protein
MVATPSVPRLAAGDSTDPVADPPSAAIDLDESFSALVTRLTITRHLDGVAMRSDLKGHSVNGPQQAAATLPGVNRRRTQPSQGVR